MKNSIYIIMLSKYAIKNENYSNVTDFERHFSSKILKFK